MSHLQDISEIDQTGAAKDAAARRKQGHENEDHLNVTHRISSNTSDEANETPGLTNGSERDRSTISRSTSSGDLTGQGNFDNFGAADAFPPLDRLSMFDVLENLALPQRLESIQHALSKQTEGLRQQRQKLGQRIGSGRREVVQQLKKRVPLGPEEQLDKYRRRMRDSVDRIGKRWNDNKIVTLKEKISFVTATMNIFISGYLIGMFPEYFHLWYTAQLCYFMPVRYWTYHKIGYHYFLADMCYFVNLLLTLSIWFFPQSKRLLISTFCLAFGNNAVAIVMWRNSLVLHSLDKVTSLFIHIMPCATLHVIVHLLPEPLQKERFPAVWHIQNSAPSAPEHYTLLDMAVWATLPYAIWQLSYHFLITVRRREQIAKGRPTSFTWLRRSYANNVLGKFVLSCPESLQEPVFMGMQYTYAMLTMLPCPLWFWYRWLSATFLLVVFAWASWNGATYYIDVFGRRMEKELNKLRLEVANMSKSPDIHGNYSDVATPAGSPSGPVGKEAGTISSALDLGPSAAGDLHTKGRIQANGLQHSMLDASTSAPDAAETDPAEAKKDA